MAKQSDLTNDMVTRLHLQREEERCNFTPVCWHCWHSIPNYMDRWKCDRCGAVARKCLLDYYVEGLNIGRNASKSALVIKTI